MQCLSPIIDNINEDGDDDRSYYGSSCVVDIFFSCSANICSLYFINSSIFLFSFSFSFFLLSIIALILSTPALYLVHSLVSDRTSCMAKVQVPETTAGPMTSVGMTVAV